MHFPSDLLDTVWIKTADPNTAAKDNSSAGI